MAIIVHVDLSLYDVNMIVPAESSESYQGLSLIRGIGAQVKKTVTNRKVRLPHTSDNAPIRGADMNDSRPLIGRGDQINNPTSAIVKYISVVWSYIKQDSTFITLLNMKISLLVMVSTF